MALNLMRRRDDKDKYAEPEPAPYLTSELVKWRPPSSTFGYGQHSKIAPPRPQGLPTDFMNQAGTTTDRNTWFALKGQLQRQPDRWGNPEWERLMQALYANPMSRQFDTKTSAPRRSAWGRVKQAARTTPGFSSEGRMAMAKIAAFVGGAHLLGTATAGAGAGAGAGAATTGGGTLTASQAAAAGIDPFLAGGGLSAASAGIPAGYAGAGEWMSSAGPASSATSSGSSAAWKKLGMALLGQGGDGGMADDGGFDWKSALIKLGLGYATNKLAGGQTSEERDLRKAATAPYEESERYLPPSLRSAAIGPTLQSGIGGIGELIRNPGGLNPAVADAVRARLAAESGNIAQSFRGIASNQAGAAARGNLPVSLKGALQSALDIAQERAQRGARQEALSESEGLRREDLNRTFAILDAILQFMQSGRGGAITGLGQAANFAQNRQAANLAQVASLLQSMGSYQGTRTA